MPKDVIRNWDHYAAKDSTLGELFNKHSRTSTAEELIEVMDETEINIAVVLGMGWADNSFNSHINDYILDSYKTFPDRLIPLTGVVPLSGDVGIYEAERCIALGSKGFGEIHLSSQGINISNMDSIRPYVNLLVSHGFPTVIHASEPVGHKYPGKGTTTPKILESFIHNFPKLKVILAHWGGGMFLYELMPEIESSFRNVYYDSSATPLLYDKHVFEIAVKVVGAGKILFGSDYPLVHPRRVMDEIAHSNFNHREVHAMLFSNAEKLFIVNQIVE